LSEPCFELRGVRVRAGERVLVGSVSLAVPRGRTLALVGPSGAGKSTLLRLMNGLVWPEAGEVRFAGYPLRQGTLTGVRRRIGYVIQEGGLFPHLSAADNAALLVRHLRWPEDRVRARLAELAGLVDLPPDALARRPRELSGGQRARVALMRALMPDPEALLLDEPLGALDALVRHRLQDELRTLIATLRKTVVLVTHDLAEAAYLADEAAVVMDGAIRQTGPVAALARAPADADVAALLAARRALPGPA
jgi:osmoprotectant transport system ATP-binding protein